MSEQEVKQESKPEEIKKFSSIHAVPSDKPKFDFSGMFPEGENNQQVEGVSPIEETKQGRKPKNADYILPSGLLGKTISALFSLLAGRYPEISDQLKLSDEECELIDQAIKPMIDSFLIQSKTKASNIAIILALAAILMPRVVLVMKAEGEKKKQAKLSKYNESGVGLK